jgi:hypothetical protein
VVLYKQKGEKTVDEKKKTQNREAAQKRMAALNKAATRFGFASWSAVETAVIKGTASVDTLETGEFVENQVVKIVLDDDIDTEKAEQISESICDLLDGQKTGYVAFVYPEKEYING